MYTLVNRESEEHYNLLSIHNREIDIHNISNRDLKILRSLITYMN